MEGTSEIGRGRGVKTTAGIHIKGNPKEGTSRIGYHFQLEISHLDMPSRGGGRGGEFMWHSPMHTHTHTRFAFALTHLNDCDIALTTI